MDGHFIKKEVRARIAMGFLNCTMSVYYWLLLFYFIFFKRYDHLSAVTFECTTRTFGQGNLTPTGFKI